MGERDARRTIDAALGRFVVRQFLGTRCTQAREARMAQIFHPSMNVIAKVSILGSLLFLALAVWTCLEFARSSYGTEMGQVVVQPIPFSHEHHVGVLGIDCRYCHTTVERASFAGMPSTQTCMNCHSQIWVGSAMLEPVRESYRTSQSISWQRVYNLPGFVYFDHSIHVQKGIGCSSCHGQVDQMPLLYQASPLLMEWCLDCHRNPERQIRPREDVFDMKYQTPDDQETLGRKLVKQYGVRDPKVLTSCSTCHR